MEIKLSYFEPGNDESPIAVEAKSLTALDMMKACEALYRAAIVLAVNGPGPADENGVTPVDMDSLNVEMLESLPPVFYQVGYGLNDIIRKLKADYDEADKATEAEGSTERGLARMIMNMMEGMAGGAVTAIISAKGLEPKTFNISDGIEALEAIIAEIPDDASVMVAMERAEGTEDPDDGEDDDWVEDIEDGEDDKPALRDESDPGDETDDRLRACK